MTKLLAHYHILMKVSSYNILFQKIIFEGTRYLSVLKIGNKLTMRPQSRYLECF